MSKKLNKLENTNTVFNPKQYNLDYNVISKVLSIVLLLLLIFSLIRIVLGSEPLRFSSFLDIIVNAPTVNFSLPLNFAGLSGQDWGIFNILKYFLDFLTQVVSVGSFILNGIVNLVVYIFYFVRVLFGY